MADRFDEMARALEQDFQCDWLPPDPRDESDDIEPRDAAIMAITEALRAEREAGFAAGQKRGLERAAGSCDERAKYWRKEQKKHREGSADYMRIGAWAVSHEDRASAIRSLPLTPEKGS